MSPAAALLLAATGCGTHAGYSGPPLYAWSDGHMENVDIYGEKICSAPERYLKPTPGLAGPSGPVGVSGQQSVVPGPPGPPGPLFFLMIRRPPRGSIDGP